MYQRLQLHDSSVELPCASSPRFIEHASHVTSVTQTFSILWPWRLPQFQPSSMGTTSNKRNHLQPTREKVFMRSKSIRCVVSRYSTTPLYMFYLCRHCYRRHKHFWPTNLIFSVLYNDYQNPNGRSKEYSRKFVSGNKETAKSDMRKSRTTWKWTWSPFQNIQNWDGPIKKWIYPPSPTYDHESEAAKREPGHPPCAPQSNRNNITCIILQTAPTSLWIS